MESVLRRGGELAHQGVDLAGRDRHDDPLDGADFPVCDFLCPGHAKVVRDSWLALPGHGRCQPDHCRGTGIEVFCVADGIVEIAVSFVLFGVEHLHEILKSIAGLFEALTGHVCVTNCRANYNAIHCSLNGSILQPSACRPKFRGDPFSGSTHRISAGYRTRLPDSYDPSIRSTSTWSPECNDLTSVGTARIAFLAVRQRFCPEPCRWDTVT